MTDNSPDFEELLRRYWYSTHIGDDIRDALRAAAAQARENAELREWQRQMVEKAAGNGVLDGYRELGEQLAAAVTRAESAESTNRALQAEVDRLNRAVERKNSALTGVLEAWNIECPNGGLQELLREAIAYTGTEPQEKTHDVDI